MDEATQLAEMQEQIEKMRYHIRLLMEEGGAGLGSYAVLAIENDWSDTDVGRMLDIVEACDKAKDTSNLEGDLKAHLGIGYQRVKGVILTLWENGQFHWVCRDYASQHRCSEFDRTGMY